MEKRTYNAEQRRTMATNGEAMPDGSFPIKDAADLRAAMRSIGRATDAAATRRHIRRRAKALGLTDMLGESFKKGHGYYEDMPFPYHLAFDPPDLPIPCTPADLTATMQAAMPEAMQADFCARFNALASPVPEGAGMSDDAAFHTARNLACEHGGWIQRPDGSYARVEVVGGDWTYEDDDAEMEPMEKAGRVLSAANERRIRDAAASLTAVLDSLPAPAVEKGAPVPVRMEVQIIKAAAEEQVCTGYAYVARDAEGRAIVDHSGDVADIASMKKACRNATRTAKIRENHEADAPARIVGSLWTDHDMLKAIGAEPGSAPAEGWLVQVEVSDPDLWKRIKSGEISAFSIGGSGRREPV